MNEYEARQEARRQRLKDRAAAARQASESAYQQARALGDVIPLGQPILVGHHSEGADRRHRNRMNANYDKAFSLHDKAKRLEERAKTVGKGGVSSDDPDAVEKLREKLEALKSQQERMKAANKAIRAKAKAGKAAQWAALVELGFSESMARELVEPDMCGRPGFPDYALQNNNANMKRIRQRIVELEAQEERQDKEVEYVWGTYREDVAENRVMFDFSGKPDKGVLDVLKANGFKWSPSRGAWVRKWTDSAEYAAQRVIEEIGNDVMVS
jgi:hypothetical protein